MQKGRAQWLGHKMTLFLESLFESHVYHGSALLSWPSI